MVAGVVLAGNQSGLSLVLSLVVVTFTIGSEVAWDAPSRRRRRPRDGQHGAEHEQATEGGDPDDPPPTADGECAWGQRVQPTSGGRSDPAPSADGRELLAGYAAESGAAALHSNLLHYGFALMAPLAYGMVYLVRRRGAALANVAWLLAVLGLSTLPGLVLIDFTGTAAVRATDLDTAYAISQELDTMGGFAAAVLPAFLASMLAVPLAAWALQRARLVPWPAIVAAACIGLAPNFVPTWWAGFGVAAVGGLVLAYYLWHIPPREWDR